MFVDDWILETFKNELCPRLVVLPPHTPLYEWSNEGLEIIEGRLLASQLVLVSSRSHIVLEYSV